MSVDMIGNKYLFLSFKIEHRDLQIRRSKDTSFDPLAFNGSNNGLKKLGAEIMLVISQRSYVPARESLNLAINLQIFCHQ